MIAHWSNRTLFHGDNLPFLRTLNSESVDLIEPHSASGLRRENGKRGYMRTGGKP